MLSTSIELNNKLFEVNIVNGAIAGVFSNADDVALCTIALLDQINSAVTYWELKDNNNNYHSSTDSLIEVNDPNNNPVTITYTLHHIKRPENGESVLVTLTGNKALLEEYELYDIGRHEIEELLIEWCADTQKEMTIEEYNLSFKRL